MQHPAAIVNVALCQLKGKGTKRSEDSMNELLKRGERFLSKSNKAFLAYHYVFDAPSEENYKKAVHLSYSVLAKQPKDTEMLYLLGFLHEGGHYFPKNYENAFFYYQQTLYSRQAAEAGMHKAMNQVGNMYFAGSGCEQNEAKAIEWYKKAAEQGNELALLNLGSYYEKTDVDLSLNYFKQAEQQKNAWASLHVGIVMLEHHMNKEEAEEHIHQSAIQGNPLAQSYFLETPLTNDELETVEGIKETQEIEDVDISME